MDKNKIIEAAAKLVAKGAYDKAIKEYQKILDADPRDVRILQKMGELYQKKNDNPTAAQFIIKVADSYARDGFFLKAVAQYKQVLKLDPTLVDVNIQLAELHQQLQLLGEAMAYYQTVANHHDKAGDIRRSLEILKRMVDLDPDNVPSRVKLADLLVREGLPQEAVAEFTKAAERLKLQNRTDDYLRVAERVSSLDPHNLTLARELAELYLQRGDQKRALAKLQLCFKANPRDIPTLRLLAQAFNGLGQTSKTLSVYKELARAHEELGQHAEAERVWSQVSQLDPHDPDLLGRHASPVPSAPPVSAVAPHASTGSGRLRFPGASAPPGGQGLGRPTPSARMPSGARLAGPGAPLPPGPSVAPPAPPPVNKPKPDSIGKLLTETDVYVKYGLHDKALEHLRKVFNVEPENLDAHEKAYAIYAASGNQAQAAEQLLNVLRLHTRLGDRERAQPYLTTILQQDPEHAEVPAFLEALGLGLGPSEEDEAAEVADDAILVDSSDDEVVIADDDTASPGAELVSDSMLEGPGELPDGDEVLAGASGADDEPLLGGGPEQPWEGQGSAGAIEDVDPALRAAQDDLASEPDTGEYLLGGGEDEPETLTSVEPLPDLALDDASAGFALADEEPVEAPPEEALAPEPVAPEAPPLDEPAQEECEEAQFFMEQQLFEEAREILETILIAYPDHRRAAFMMGQLIELEAMQLPPSRDAVEIAQELDHEVSGSGLSVAPQVGEDYQVSVEEVFAEFKKGLEKVVKPEDVETHYDLGIAYKEMGLIDDAISEFAIARKGCPGKKKEVDCLNMVGVLQLMRGDPQAAIQAFRAALATEFAVGDTEKALRFELGTAFEAAEQYGLALGQYLQVQAVDPGFRDVPSLIERLALVAQPEDDESSRSKPSARPAGSSSSRKVGYV